ncbi:pilus assembly protein PilF [Rhodopirellula sp.]|nr:pilus assembly protein PilF [Rhodopirellula sp.]
MTTHLLCRMHMIILPLVLLLPLSLGCGSIRKDKRQDFLKPFASVAPSGERGHSQTIPSDYTLCVETAKTVAALGHAEEAIKLYEHAETLDSAAPSLHSQLAPLYASLGDYFAAIARYQLCTAQSPDDVELCNNFAWTLMEAGQFKQAIAEANRGLQINNHHTRLQATLAMIHYQQGDDAKALQGFERAHGPIAAHHNLSLLDIDSGNLESAKDHLQIARQSPETNGQAEVMLTALEAQTSTH